MGLNQPGQPAGLEGSISRLEYLHSRDAPWVTLEELLCALARLEDSSLGQGIQAPPSCWELRESKLIVSWKGAMHPTPPPM